MIEHNDPNHCSTLDIMVTTPSQSEHDLARVFVVGHSLVSSSSLVQGERRVNGHPQTGGSEEGEDSSDELEGRDGGEGGREGREGGIYIADQNNYNTIIRVTILMDWTFFLGFAQFCYISVLCNIKSPNSNNESLS